MKRYEITPEFILKIKNSGYKFDYISDKLGFEIRNILYRNMTLREDYLSKLGLLLKTNFKLKEKTLDYGKNLGENYFTKDIYPIKEGENLSEFIGIMLGDGNMYKNQVKIFFNKKDKEYIDYVKDLAKRLIGLILKELPAKNSNGLMLYCCNKYLADKLIEFGLKRGSKIKNQISIPIWIKDNPIYSKKCIKGLIDTDGCLIFCKRDKQLHINFSNHNPQLLNDFKEIAKSVGYNFTKANKWNTRLYRRAEVARFINDIKPFKSMNGAVVQFGKIPALGVGDPGSNP
ncbi:MAG: LAGLIDADG family homing endonuclease, partial [Nanoarchaeota archaeon]